MLVRSPSNNFDVVDLTSAVRNIPIQYGTFNQLGIFSEEGVASDTVMFEESTLNGALIVDRVRGEKNSVSKDGSRKLHTFAIPHFPLDDYITPKDLQNKSAYEDFNAVEQLDNVRTRKIMLRLCFHPLLMHHLALLPKTGILSLISAALL